MMNAPVIPSYCNIVWALHIGGHLEGAEAKRRIVEAQDLAARLRRPFSHAFVHLHTIVLCHFRQEYAEVRSRVETLIELSTEYGFPYWLAAGKMCLARTIAGEGYHRGDQAAIESGLAMMKSSGRKSCRQQRRPHLFVLFRAACGNLLHDEADRRMSARSSTSQRTAPTRWSIACSRPRYTASAARRCSPFPAPPSKPSDTSGVRLMSPCGRTRAHGSCARRPASRD